MQLEIANWSEGIYYFSLVTALSVGSVRFLLMHSF